VQDRTTVTVTDYGKKSFYGAHQKFEWR